MNMFPLKLSEEKSTFPLAVIIRYVPIKAIIIPHILLKDILLLKKTISKPIAKIGTRDVIKEALEAVVNLIPVFSQQKYKVIPRKPPKANFGIIFFFI